MFSCVCVCVCVCGVGCGVWCVVWLWAYGVVVSMFDFQRSDRVRIPFVARKFHNVYDYTVVWHP